jgi:hypothetical protein
MSTPAYAAAATVFTTTALDGLAASTTFVAGRQCAVIDNTTNKYIDAILSGKFKANNTAPTAGQILVWVGELLDDTNYPDTFGAADAAVTVTSADIRNAALKLAMAITTDATANRIYPFDGVSVASLFGGILPPKWFVWVTHNMVQALNATANNGGQCYYKGITAP